MGLKGSVMIEYSFLTFMFNAFQIFMFTVKFMRSAKFDCMTLILVETHFLTN